MLEVTIHVLLRSNEKSNEKIHLKSLANVNEQLISQKKSIPSCDFEHIVVL